MRANYDQAAVCGIGIEHDASGIGNCWRPLSANNLPANVAEEIAAEILDGRSENRELFVASNGQHYRWFISGDLLAGK